MSLAPPFRRPGDPPIPRAYGGCGCSCHRMAGVKHCVPCCYPGKDGVGGRYYEPEIEELIRGAEDAWVVGPPIDTKEALEFLLDEIEKSEMDPKHDHLNKLLEDSDRPDAGKPRC